MADTWVKSLTEIDIGIEGCHSQSQMIASKAHEAMSLAAILIAVKGLVNNARI